VTCGTAVGAGDLGEMIKNRDAFGEGRGIEGALKFAGEKLIATAAIDDPAGGDFSGGSVRG
jgi:hypothetical protein